MLGVELQTWKATQRGTPLRTPSPHDLLDELRRQADRACSIEDLLRVAADAAEVRRSYERSGIIKRPIAGDQAVKDAVKDSISEPLNALQTVIFEAVWATADEGLDRGIRNGVATALWEVTRQVIETRVSQFAAEAANAVKSGDPKEVLRAGAQAAKEIAASFADRDGRMRDLLRIMSRNNIVLDKALEQAVRRYVAKIFERAAKGMLAFAKLLSAPIMIFLRIFFTSSTTADDAGMLYLSFQGLERGMHRRYRELAPTTDQAPAVEPGDAPPTATLRSLP